MTTATLSDAARAAFEPGSPWRSLSPAYLEDQTVFVQL